MLNVIRAMCAHDADLAEALGAARAARAADPDGPVRLPPQVAVIGPPGILQATLDALRIHVLDRTTSSWWDGYGHARAYHQQHGNLDVPHAYVTAGGYPLGTWLSAQRAERNSGALTAERIRLLDALGMIWDLLEDAWMAAYRELRAFSDAHGHFEVPLDYVTADGIRLGGWQGTQRDTDRAGKTDQPAPGAAGGDRVHPGARQGPLDPPLRAARRRRHPVRRPRQPAPGSLRRPGWRASCSPSTAASSPTTRSPCSSRRASRPPPRTPGAAAYQDLLAFKDEHGHLRVPAGYRGEAGIDLCDWQRDQRVRRKGGRG